MEKTISQRAQEISRNQSGNPEDIDVASLSLMDKIYPKQPSTPHLPPSNEVAPEEVDPYKMMLTEKVTLQQQVTQKIDYLKKVGSQIQTPIATHVSGQNVIFAIWISLVGVAIIGGIFLFSALDSGSSSIDKDSKLILVPRRN